MAKLTGIIDEPVSSGGQDHLDISVHTKSLIRFIRETNTPITIGIQGEWGSGKTSLLNSIYHDFSSNQECKQIWINSWEYSLLSSPEESLLKIINKIIDDLLDSDIDVERKTKIKSGAEKLFKGALRIGATAVGGLEAGNVAKELLGSSDQSISQLRGQLNELVDDIAARETNPFKKILIYVDDLDRIEPKNAVAILELLKNIFSIPHCVFILAIDYQVVVKGLESKFGKQTPENEWEFRAFFDKIIQLPFMMPMGEYNIGKYVNHLLTGVGFVGEEGLEDEDISEVILRTIGGNPRSIKRLVNNVSLIQIITEEKLASDSGNPQTGNDGAIKIDTETEKFLIFALLCLQIAYPAIYSVLTRNPDFPNWDEALAKSEEKFKEKQKKDLFDSEFNVVQDSEDFDQPWEKVLFRICYDRPRVKPLVEDISKFFNYLKSKIEASKADIGDSIVYVLNQISVTSVASTDQGHDQPKKKFSVENLTVKDSVDFTFNNKNYTLTLFKEKGALRLYDENKKEMKARKIFADIIAKENLDIKIGHTRQMGPKVLNYFKKKNKG